MDSNKRRRVNTSSSISEKGFYALLAILLTGFILLLLQHSLFMKLQAKLEAQAENERNRITIGHMIIADLRQVEAFFYRLPTSTDNDTQQLLHDNILTTLARVNNALSILEKGGTIDFHMPLNLPERDEMVTTVHYQPDRRGIYILEIIDLRPKLADIAEKTDTMLELARTRDKLQGDGNPSEWKVSIQAIKGFLKNVSPSFVRMDENVNQLFFNSSESLSRFEKTADAKQKQYRQLEAFLVVGTIIIILLFAANIYRKQEAIAELKRSEEALSNAYRHYAGIVDGLDKIVYVSDFATHEILFVNRYARQRFGDIVGRKCYQIFGEEDHEGICSCCLNRETLFNNQGERGCEFTRERKKDDKWYEIHGQMINWDDNHKAFHVLIFDISEQKMSDLKRQEMEERLHHSHKMEAIGTLAGGIAHDFNNILSAIIGFSELAKNTLPPGTAAREDIDQVINSGKRAAALVQQILDFSRKTEQKLQPLRPHLIVQEVLQMLRSTLPTTVEIQTDIDHACGTIMADSTKFHQVVLNLCTNAFHALKDEKGTLRVTLSHQKRIEEDNGASVPFVVLSVSDTGQGMDPETKAHIFDPYFTTKGQGRRKGTGLGLATVHGIIEVYKGFIEVESEPGHGSTFSVFIPALEENTATLEKSEREEPLPVGIGTERILVVDDEPLLVRINTRLLEDYGYTVTGVTDSLEALKKVRAEPKQFDLIVTDQTMPGLTGSELAKEVLEIAPNMPIILCSGHSAVTSEENALAMGIKKYIYKPVDGDDLVRTVRMILDER